MLLQEVKIELRYYILDYGQIWHQSEILKGIFKLKLIAICLRTLRTTSKIVGGNVKD